MLRILFCIIIMRRQYAGAGQGGFSGHSERRTESTMLVRLKIFAHTHHRYCAQTWSSLSNFGETESTTTLFHRDRITVIYPDICMAMPGVVCIEHRHARLYQSPNWMPLQSFTRVTMNKPPKWSSIEKANAYTLAIENILGI